MKKSSKQSIYLCLISLIPIVISLTLIPWFSFEVGLIICIMTPIYIILMLLAIRHARKDIVHYHHRMGKITARTVYIFEAIIPISVLIIGPAYNIVYTGLDFIIFVLWGISSVMNIIAAIIYKSPKKKQQSTMF